MKSVDRKVQKFKKLKLLYNKVAEHHKYFLSWRQILLAGYFALVGVIFYSMYFLIDKNNQLEIDKNNASDFIIAAICGAVIFLMSKLFIQLDKRNSELYQICQNVGANIEKKILKNKKSKTRNISMFLLLSESHKITNYKTHSKVVEIIYNCTGYIGLIISISIFIMVLKEMCVILC